MPCQGCGVGITTFLAELLLGTRLASHSGGAIAYVTTHTTAR
ncbi:hypothetical protein [Streptomyces chartreusis]